MTGIAANQPTTFGKTVRQSQKLLAELSENELAIARDVYEMLEQSIAASRELAAAETIAEGNRPSDRSEQATNNRQQLLQRFKLPADADTDCSYIKLTLRDRA